MSHTRRYPVRKLLVIWMFLLSAVAFLDRTNVSIAGPSIRDELGIDNIRLGWIFSAFLIGYAAFQVAGGWLAFRFGPRRVLAAGVLWWGVFTALTTIVSSHLAHALLILVLVRLSLGAGEAVMYPATNQFVSQWIPVAERGSANGWIFAGVGAGAGLSIPILTWIISNYGWRLSFWFCAVIGVLVGAVWYVIARDRPEQHAYVAAAELKLIQATRSTGADPPPCLANPLARCSFEPQHRRLVLELLQFRLCRLDLLQLVLHLHGAGPRIESQSQRDHVDDSVYRDDRLLSRGGRDQRLYLAPFRSSERQVWHRVSLVRLDRHLSRRRLGGSGRPGCKRHSCRRRRRAIPLAEFLLGCQCGSCR